MTAVQAAGAVLWRVSRKHGTKVVLVHRPRYDDWSLPKGKSRAGESPLTTAAREVQEETGFAIALGRRLTVVNYEVAIGPKTVQYFVARPVDGSFHPTKEVDRIEWLPIARARRRLVHEFDQAVLDTFALQPPDLPGVILVRHAHAGQRESFDGDDDDRPLDASGRKRAQALVAELVAFSPGAIHSAPIRRCLETVAPLARALALEISGEPAFVEEAYRDDPAAARQRLTELAASPPIGGPAVACSQGGVIPGVVKSLAGRAGLQLQNVGTSKGAYWYLTFDANQLVQADRYATPEI